MFHRERARRRACAARSAPCPSERAQRSWRDKRAGATSPCRWQPLDAFAERRPAKKLHRVCRRPCTAMQEAPRAFLRWGADFARPARFVFFFRCRTRGAAIFLGSRSMVPDSTCRRSHHGAVGPRCTKVAIAAARRGGIARTLVFVEHRPHGGARWHTPLGSRARLSDHAGVGGAYGSLAPRKRSPAHCEERLKAGRSLISELGGGALRWPRRRSRVTASTSRSVDPRSGQRVSDPPRGGNDRTQFFGRSISERSVEATPSGRVSPGG